MSTQKYQYLAGFIVNLGGFGLGLSVGWGSSYVPLLKSINSPLESGPVSLEEISWIVANICLGGLIGGLFYGKISGKFGRKYSIASAAIPQIISWILIIIGTNPTYLWIARFLNGFTSGSVYATNPVYISEIAENKVRGTIGSFLSLFVNVGGLVGYILGTFIDYSVFPIIGLCISIVFFLGMLYLPETPFYCLSKGQEEKAERSLGFYRGINNRSEQKQSVIFQQEMDILRNRLETVSNSGTKISCSDFASPEAKKATIIVLIMVACTQLIGGFTILNYTSTIFESSDSALSPNLGAIIVAIPQVIGSYTSMMLVDRIGRRILVLFSVTVNIFSLIILGIYNYYQTIGVDVSSLNWLPLLCIGISLCAIYSGGIPIAFVVASEILPRKIINFIMSIAPSIPWFIGFLLLKFFPYLLEILNLYGCMWMFAGFNAFEVIVVFFMLPETKGKSFEEIYKLLK